MQNQTSASQKSRPQKTRLSRIDSLLARAFIEFTRIDQSTRHSLLFVLIGMWLDRRMGYLVHGRNLGVGLLEIIQK
ncbi:hypothetical protein [Bartonella apihabitans]|uniref:hypothetical protein n=1 Tax=Bartonella apihabitans TaxID=2750929 RepID=UPI003BB76D33